MDDEVGKERRFLFGCQLCKEEGERPFKIDDCHSRNLRRHMTRCHPDHSLSKRRKTLSSSPTSTDQSSLFDSPVWRNMREAESSRQKTKDELNLALYCVDALLPFSELSNENSGLIALSRRFAGRKVQPLSAYNLKGKFFPAMTSFFREKVKNLSHQYVSLCVDGWTCKTTSKDSYLGVTAHTLRSSDSGDTQRLPVGIWEIRDRHTGENLLRVLILLLAHAGIDKDNVIQIVTDNGANVMKMSKLFFMERNGGWLLSRSYWGCCAHSLQRSVLILLDDSKVKTMIQTIRSTVQAFRQPGTIAKRQLRRVQDEAKVSPLVLLLDVNTRWNSTYCMLKRYKRIFRFVKQAVEELNMHVALIDEDLIEKVLSVLKPFKRATTRLSHEQASSLSHCAIVIKKLFDEIGEQPEEVLDEDKGDDEGLYDGTDFHDYSVPPACEVDHSEMSDEMAGVEEATMQESTSGEWTSDFREHINALKKKIVHDMSKRFRHILNQCCDTTLATLYLTPTHLTEYISLYACDVVETFQRVRTGAQREIIRILKKTRTSSEEGDVITSSEKVDEVDTSSEATAASKERHTFFKVAIAGHRVLSSSHDDDLQALIEAEMVRYEVDIEKSLGRQNLALDTFWDEDRRTRFPSLHSARTIVCCCMGTSVPAERLFSTSSSMLTKARNRLSPSSSFSQLYLHEAVRNVPFDEGDLFEHVYSELNSE